MENPGQIQNIILEGIGDGYRLLRQAGPDPRVPDYSHADLMDINGRNDIMDELGARIRALEIRNIQEFALNISDDMFKEILMNNIKNEVISYQAFIFKKSKESEKKLKNKISVLKKHYAENFNEISDLENKLRSIYDTKIIAELEKNPNFVFANSENITPFFLKMAKGSKNEQSLREIRD